MRSSSSTSVAGTLRLTGKLELTQSTPGVASASSNPSRYALKNETRITVFQQDYQHLGQSRISQALDLYTTFLANTFKAKTLNGIAIARRSGSGSMAMMSLAP